MKAKIHPKYVDCKVTCGCGEIFMTRATQAEMNVEICSKCHPFFTGKQKLVDTAGRVEKFQRRYAKFQAQSAAAAPVAADSSAPAESVELRTAGAAASATAPADAPASEPEPAAPAQATAAPEKPTSAAEAPADKPDAPQN